MLFVSVLGVLLCTLFMLFMRDRIRMSCGSTLREDNVRRLYLWKWVGIMAVGS
jgi:hypothetical protein